MMWYVRHSPAKQTGTCVGQFPIEVQHSVDKACQLTLNQAPIIPDQIYSSDLPRCENLARALSNIWNIPLIIDKRLREISMGHWEGRTYQDIEKRDPTHWHTWCQKWQTAQPPGGECLNTFSERVREWHLSSQQPHVFSSNELLIAHAGVIRAMYALLGTPWEKAISIKVPHLCWQKINPIE